MKVRRMAVVLAFVAVAMALPSAAEAAVVIRGTTGTAGFVWKPKTTTVATGTRVRWKAVVGTHTVVAYGGNWSFSKSLPAGTVVAHTFKHAGTFRFFCSIHGSVTGGVCSGMCGKVVVG